MPASPSPGTPWYREPWPWLLASGPAAAVVAGLITLAIAVESDDGLVADDYYKRGLAVNQVLSRDAQARRLGLRAAVSFSAMRVRIVLEGALVPPPELRLRLIHPTRSGKDQSLKLRAIAPGVYEGTPAPLEGEMRRMVLEDAQATWRLAGTWSGRQEAVALGTAR
ncbi:MAG TPA: FixH family protein [Burkholderiales bacterium]|nr:FixH family protein [Burkholderiales bacterium]